MFSFLQKPYPIERKNEKFLLTNLAIGTFIFLFLYVFKPMGLHDWETPYKTLKLAGFGFISFIIPSIYQFITNTFIPAFYLDKNWKVWKEIVSVLTVLSLIALGNLLFLHYLGATALGLKQYFNALLTVILVGAFPVTLNIILKHNRFLKLNLQQAQLINKEIEHIHHPQNQNEIQTPPAVHDIENAFVETEEKKEEKTEDTNTEIEKTIFIAENEKDTFEIINAQLLYIESTDNYSTLFYWDKKVLKKQMIRSSLKRLESQIKSPAIMRCHRAYIVNLNNVEHCSGNAAGYKLSFFDCDNTISVSRNYGAKVLEVLKGLDKN